MNKKISSNKNKLPQGKRIPNKATHVKKSHYFLLLIILLISLFAYIPVLNNGFVWDDDNYIRNNLLIRSINLNEIFSSYVYGNYHPITILFHSIEYHFFGLSEKGYHIVNLLIHLLNVILVYYTIFLLCDKIPVALLVSLLFGIHPMHVESVAWAAELKDLLYTFFFLASFIYYLKYIRDKKRNHYFIALLLFLFSLLSKAMAVSLPVLLLLTDYFKGNKITIKIIFEKVPFFVLSIIIGVVAINAQRILGATDIVVFSLPQRLVFACYGFFAYIYKLLLPLNLCSYYPYPIKSGYNIPSLYYVFPLLLILFSIIIFYSIRYTNKIIFGVGFFSITIFLVLQILPIGGVIISDRYSYIPSIGIFYIISEGFYWIWIRKKSIEKLKYAAAFLLSISIFFFATKTYSRCFIWKNGLTLWDNVISQYQTIPMAYSNRGVQLASRKNFNGALMDYNKAIELEPRFAKAYNNRGILYASQNKNEQALNDFNRAIELEPDYGGAYNNRGGLFIYTNKFDEAYNDFNKALELDPGLATAYFNRGMIEINSERKEKGCNDLKKSSSLGYQPATDKYNELCQ